jgi:hypothetical protein
MGQENTQPSPQQSLEKNHIRPLTDAAVDKVAKALDQRVKPAEDYKASFEGLRAQIQHEFATWAKEQGKKVIEGSRDQFADLKQEMATKLDEATSVIMATIYQLAQRNNDKKLTVKELYELASGMKGMLASIEQNYGTMYRGIIASEPLNPQDTAKLIAGLEPIAMKKEGYQPLDIMGMSGPYAVVNAMNSDQLLEFSKSYIAQKPQQAEEFIRGMLMVGRLSVLQGRKLWNASWGAYPEKDIASEQREVEKARVAFEKDNLNQSDDSNEMVKFMKPGNLAGIALQLWRGINLGLNVLNHWKTDKKGIFTNPIVWADLALIKTGRDLTHGRPILGFLNEKSAADKNTEAAKAEKARTKELLARYPQFAENYLEKGGSEIMLAFVEKMKADKRDPTLAKVEDIAKFDQQYTARSGHTKTQQDTDRQAFLVNAMKDEDQKFGAQDIVTAIVNMRSFSTAGDIHQIVDEVKRSVRGAS